jgi:hypothetical protein
MTSPFPLQLALGQHQYEAIEKLLRVMDPNCIMVCIRAAEKMGWGNLIFLFDTVKDLSQEVVVDGIRTVSAKGMLRTRWFVALYNGVLMTLSTRKGPTSDSSSPWWCQFNPQTQEMFSAAIYHDAV